MAPILAAGGIVVKGGSRPLIALVQRRKDDEWVLPKGKLKRRENALAAARREVMEETGHDVFVHEFLGAISYPAGRKPKLVQFWRMQAVHGVGHKPTRDIKAVDWLPLESAIEKLSIPLEQVFLRNVGPQALKHMRIPVRPPRSVRPDRIYRTEHSLRAPVAAATTPEPVVAGPPATMIKRTSRKRFLQFILNAFSGRRQGTNGAQLDRP